MYISSVPEQSIRGGSNIGIHATDIIGEVTLAIKNYLTAEQIAETIHAHPTTSDVIHCRACCRGRGNTLCLNASNRVSKSYGGYEGRKRFQSTLEITNE